MDFHHGPATFHLLGEDRVGVANQEGEAGRLAKDTTGFEPKHVAL
jgi:hypothetical protein